MHAFCCRIGNWRAEARVEEVQADRLMAVISVTRGNGLAASASLHTVVFEHRDGADSVHETEIMMQHLLQGRYGD